MTIPVITIDGPSGSGKGTIAQWLAQKLGWHLLDSGALYRAVALAALQRQLPLDNADIVANCAQNLGLSFKPVVYGGVEVYLSGQNVSLDLRTEDCAAVASKVAAIPAVRAALLIRQRRFREAPGLIADGRDMGTVVFADASLKIYLTASAAERAKRRYKQLKDKGISANLAALQRDIEVRDERDYNRTTAPLKPAEDAHIIDTSTMPVDAVCSHIYQLFEQYVQGAVPGR